MNEMNFSWDDLRLFVAVARKGGLAAAVASTGKSAPTLGRRMLALERALGRELFLRRARGYALTEDGKNLLEKAEALEDGVLSLAAGTTKTPPLVKISAGTWVTYFLCGKLEELVGSQPVVANPVRLRFIAADEVLDIGRREAVIGIRNQRPEDVGLAGRRIGKVQFAGYALSPGIENWVQVVGTTPSARWVQAQTSEAQILEVTNPRNALDLALAGTARVVLPTFIGERFDNLQQVTGPIKDLAHDQWLVTHHEDRFLPEVRAMIERIFAVLKEIGSGR